MVIKTIDGRPWFSRHLILHNLAVMSEEHDPLVFLRTPEGAAVVEQPIHLSETMVVYFSTRSSECWTYEAVSAETGELLARVNSDGIRHLGDVRLALCWAVASFLVKLSPGANSEQLLDRVPFDAAIVASRLIEAVRDPSNHNERYFFGYWFDEVRTVLGRVIPQDYLSGHFWRVATKEAGCPHVGFPYAC